MRRKRVRAIGFGALATLGLGVWGFAAARNSDGRISSRGISAQDSAQQGQPAAAKTAPAPVLPRGKKLMLKDGSFQLVREYKVEGDRVRYYSVDSHQWEEIPATLVDWDATKKMEEEQAKSDAATVAKVHTLEVVRAAPLLDIDASLEAAPGVFLPQGDGVYVFASKSVVELTQADIDSRLDKGRVLKQILVPIPIVPSRHDVSIKGTRAKLRITDSQPEFYARTADAHQPQMELIHAKINGYSRHLENIDSLFKKESTKADTVPIQCWPIAHGVFRFTLGQPLEPGEYALAEMVQDENNTSIYVWDLGVDAAGAGATGKSK
ncbi:MAG: hypothetical protein WB780_04255 [Candidatus Acidiferrales bacterium]